MDRPRAGSLVGPEAAAGFVAEFVVGPAESKSRDVGRSREWPRLTTGAWLSSEWEDRDKARRFATTWEPSDTPEVKFAWPTDARGPAAELKMHRGHILG